MWIVLMPITLNSLPVKKFPVWNAANVPIVSWRICILEKQTIFLRQKLSQWEVTLIHISRIHVVWILTICGSRTSRSLSHVLRPFRQQAIVGNNTGLLLTGSFGNKFSFKKTLKWPIKCRSFSFSFTVQSSAVITRSNLSQFHICHCDDSNR